MKSPIKILNSDGSYVTSENISLARVSASTTIYVDNLYGNDTTGNGTFVRPYKTVYKGFQLGYSDPRWSISNPAIIVNASTGNDGTGARFGGKFATLSAALACTGITSGDCIYVEAGTYNNAAGTLCKDGIDWYFASGTVINSSNTEHTFSSSGGSANNWSVAGHGQFTSTGRIIYHDTNGYVYFQAKSIASSGTGGSYRHFFEQTVGSATYGYSVYIQDKIVRNTVASAGYYIGYGYGKCSFYIHGAEGYSHMFYNYSSTAGSVFNLHSIGDITTPSGTGYCILSGGATTNSVTNIYVIGDIRSDAANGSAVYFNGGNANVFVSGIISSGGQTAINHAINTTVTIVAFEIISLGGGGTGAVYLNAANTMNVTARYIKHINPYERAVSMNANSVLAINDADIQGDVGSGNVGAIYMAGAQLTLKDCIVRCKVGNNSIFGQASTSNTVTYNGACQIATSVSNVTEINTGNRTIDSGLILV